MYVKGSGSSFEEVTSSVEEIKTAFFFLNILLKTNLQFGFQKGHSPEYAIIQLVEQINQSFEKNLSKSFG